ncbi:single-stranded DNA-binding protein [Peptostreptococcaceae bacterium AGR-M142]
MNQVIIIGRLTRDPELRYIPGSGRPVASFSVAVQRPFANKDGVREADFFNVQSWGKQAENCANYLAKGRLVAVSGRLQTRKYQTQNGENRVATEIISDKVEFLEWGDQGNKGNSNLNSNNNEFEKTFEPTGNDPDGFEALDDDDIPF